MKEIICFFSICTQIESEVCYNMKTKKNKTIMGEGVFVCLNKLGKNKTLKH